MNQNWTETQTQRPELKPQQDGQLPEPLPPERLLELQPYLQGLTPQLPEPFFRLAEIIRLRVFELDSTQGDCRIPYMMNDALEYYLILENSVLTGEFDADSPVQQGRISWEEGRYALILQQENGNLFTLHFDTITEHAACYRYHEIGHFWRPGQEHWRQLVYIIGTLCDKYEYFGDRFCSEAEQKLLPLMNFEPFRYYSSIREPLDWYPDDVRGWQTIRQLAMQAGDTGFVNLLRLCRPLPKPLRHLIWRRALQSSARQKLYEQIWAQVEAASRAYGARDYGAAMNERIEEERRRAANTLTRLGFAGAYPDFAKPGMQVHVAEEHPFTTMEYDNFEFKLQLMVSVCDGADGRCAGFFRGRGRRGRILKLEELEKLAQERFEKEIL